MTNEDWGTLGICAGYVSDINIEHNEISDVSYSGISLGWGWTRTVNCMRNNRVHANLIHHYAKHMYDVAGIYTLGSQPHSRITENCVSDIFHPVMHTIPIIGSIFTPTKDLHLSPSRTTGRKERSS